MTISQNMIQQTTSALLVKRSYTWKDLQILFNFKSRNTPFNWEKNEGFPQHIKIGCRAYWDADAVDTWLKERFAKQQTTSAPQSTQQPLAGEENAG